MMDPSDYLEEWKSRAKSENDLMLLARAAIFSGLHDAIKEGEKEGITGHRACLADLVDALLAHFTEHEIEKHMRMAEEKRRIAEQN